MKFSGKTEIQASLNDIFAAFADFDAFEKYATKSGAEVSRIDDLISPGPGMIWDSRFEYRGKRRKATIELIDYNPPESLNFSAVADGFDAVMRIELIRLSAKETRARITFEVQAKSIAARLVLQSARLTKNRLNKRFRERLHRFGHDLEQRIQSA